MASRAGWRTGLTRAVRGLGSLSFTCAVAGAAVACSSGPPAASRPSATPPRTSPARTASPAPTASPTPRAAISAGQVTEISRCAGRNAEVVQAADGRYVYELWIGCGGIGFARSTDGGRSFGNPLTMPESAGQGFYQNSSVSGLPKYGWDPAIAVGPNGTVYVSYMVYRNGYDHPVVGASFDHGATFAQVSNIVPPRRQDWGDRDYIAVAPDGTVYLTWDYGQSLRTRYANIVIQRSTNGGRTWGPLSPVSPGFPDHGGGVGGIILVEPRGRIDLLFWVLKGGVPRPALPGGFIYFTSSTDRGSSWSRPVPVQPGAGTIGTAVTWIDGQLGIDAGGNLYATWDTQRPGVDIGWLSYSTDHGQTWSAAQRATPDNDNAEHIMAVTGRQTGVAYVGWLASNSPHGFAAYLRPFSVSSGWRCAPSMVSRQFGARNVWPGDTIGITVLPRRQNGRALVMLSWGSAVTNQMSQIWAAYVEPC
jgi:hypothetical protein